MAAARLLTDVQVANRYQIPVATLRTGRSRGYGPPFLKLGRAVRYRATDVEGWLSSKLVQPGQQQAA